MAGKHFADKLGKEQEQAAKPVASPAAGSLGVFIAKLLANKKQLFAYQKICVLVVAFLVFANGIPNDFNIDDNYYTTDANPVANMGIKGIPTIFTTNTLHDNSNNSFDYRPIAMLSFALQHQFLGGSAVTGHFINVLIYSFLCLLFFLLLCEWVGPERRWFAFFVTLLYAVHPLHTEVVDNIKSRDELLASIIGLLSVFAAWKWHINKRWGFLVLSCFLMFVALLSKQSAILYMLLIPMAFYFFTDLPIKKVVFSFFVLVLPFLLYSIVNGLFTPGQKIHYYFFENPMLTVNVPLHIKTATASYIFGSYSYLHVMPYPLSFFYGYMYVQLVPWHNIFAIVSAVVMLLLIVLIVKSIRRKTLIAFGALFYLGSMLPLLNLHAPAAGMMAERFAFASSFGYCFFLVAVLYWVFKILPESIFTNKNQKYFLMVFLAIFVSYTAMSITRNSQWKNRWILMSHDIKHLQQSVKANMLYAEQLKFRVDTLRSKLKQQSGATAQAYQDSIQMYLTEEKDAFLRALDVSPDYDYALMSAGVIYIDLDSCGEAKKYLQRALQVAPGNPDIHYNMAIDYSCLQMMDSAVMEFRKVLSINPQYYPAYSEISMIYLKQHDTAKAISTLLAGVKNVPDISLLYMQLASIYFYKKDTVQAMYFNERGAAVTNPDPSLFLLLQNYYHGKNDIQKENYYKDKLKKQMSR